jgi:chromosome segregation ATPase
MSYDHHKEDEARWVEAMRQRHARGQEYVCGLADVMRTLAERDEARAEVESAQRHCDGLARSLAAATAHCDYLRAEAERLRGERDEAREHTSTAAFMRIERERDEARHRARRACQMLIAEVGAEGPADVDSVAERAAAEIRDLRDQVADLLAAQEESEHSMHLRIRSGYDKTIADCWRAKVAEVEAERDEARDEVHRLRAGLASLLEASRPALRVLDKLGVDEWSAFDDAVTVAQRMLVKVER